MLRTQITIINKLGLHARAAAKLVSCTARFLSDIHIEHNGQRVNGKSIMGVMMLAASQGTTLTLLVDGADEEQAASQITELVNDHFGEEE